MQYDLVIIGGGPAGLSAALYAARYNLKTVVLAKDFGHIVKSSLIENYPGVESTDGITLITRMRKQVTALKVTIKNATIKKIEKTKSGFKATSNKGESYEAKALLLASGSQPRLLNLKGEDKYAGKGVSYCTTCDAPIFKGKAVAVLGGSNSAATAALHASDFAKKVTIIYRGEELRAQPILVEKIKAKKNIEIITKSNIIELKGDKMLTGLKFDTGKELKVEGLFIEIGHTPSSEMARRLGAELDEKNYVKVNPAQMTNIPGLFAAGDLTNACNNLKQLVTAAAQGAVAANAIFMFLNNKAVGH